MRTSVAWAVVLLLVTPGAAIGQASEASSVGEPTRAPSLAFWLTTPDTTPARPLRFAVVRRDAEGKLIDPGAVEVTASHGRIETEAADRGALRIFHLVPPPDHRGDLTIEARVDELKATRRLVLTSPEVAKLEISVEPKVLIKKPDATATVTVKISGVAKGTAPPILWTNLGSLTPLVPAGEGLFRATYRPGKKRYPEVAILSAFQPFPDAGSPAFALAQAALPLAAAIDLPGKTRPRVQMSVEIAGETFGPVPSDARGHFLVPVVVPPGHGKAKGVSIDKLGNRRRTPIDLQLPPTNRLAVTAYPLTLVADGHDRAQVVVTVIDAFGRPTSGKPPRLGAERGRVSRPESAGEGIYRAWYTAPVEVGDGSDRLTVTLPRRRESKAALEVKLRSAAPARGTLKLSAGVVAAPSEEVIAIGLEVEDRRGNPVPTPRIRTEVARGELIAVDALHHRYRPPPTPEGWEDALTFRVAPPVGERAVSAAIDPARGSLVLLDVGGRPVPGVPVRIARADEGVGHHVEAPLGRTDEGGGLALHPTGAGVLELLWPGRSEPFRVHRGEDAEGRAVVFPRHVGEILLRTKITLMEPEPVRVRISVEAVGGEKARVRWEVNEDAGERTVLLRVGRREPVEQRGLSGEWKGEAKVGELVTVTDTATGVVGVTEVRAP